MNDSGYSDERTVALAAVREAGKLCRQVQDGIAPDTLQKQDRSPVTVADYGSQALICRALGEAFPDDPIIAEEDSAALRTPENKAVLASVLAHVRTCRPDADTDAVCSWIDRGNAKDYTRRFWTLDPIDGTKGFLRGQQYAVALALIVDGQVVLSALCCPNLGPALHGERAGGSVFIAELDQGTWQTTMDGETTPVRVQVSSCADPTRIRFCESVEAAHSSHDDAVRIAEKLQIAAESVRLDSQTKYAVVARGEAEAYLRLPKSAEYQEKIWDHAAGLLVVTEAGGRVTDIHGRDLDFTHGYKLLQNSGVIVTNGQVHPPVLQAIMDLGISG
jgi:3'(2'), 5'-bisphosphate nucleotidase